MALFKLTRRRVLRVVEAATLEIEARDQAEAEVIAEETDEGELTFIVEEQSVESVTDYVDPIEEAAPAQPHICDPNHRRELLDARGIFCAFVCDECEAEKKARYRPEIFSDPGYEHDEPIEPDDY